MSHHRSASNDAHLPSSLISQSKSSWYSKDLSVLWLDKVGKGLWLSLVGVGVAVVQAIGVVMVVVSVSIVLWADVFHLVDGAALWAALNWALAGHLGLLVYDLAYTGKAGLRRKGRGSGRAYGQPDGDVGVGWGTGATSVLLVAERSDHDWVGKGT